MMSENPITVKAFILAGLKFGSFDRQVFSFFSSRVATSILAAFCTTLWYRKQ